MNVISNKHKIFRGLSVGRMFKKFEIQFTYLKIHYFEVYYVAFSIFIRLIFFLKRFYISPHFINGLEVANRKYVIQVRLFSSLIPSWLLEALNVRKITSQEMQLKYNFSNLINAEIDKRFQRADSKYSSLWAVRSLLLVQG